MHQRRPPKCTATQLCLTLPLPPSINAQYYTDREGMRRLTPQALRFKDQVRQIMRNLWLKDIMQDAFLQRMRNPRVYLAVYVEAFFATPLQRDLDNICKITLDSISAGASSGEQRVDDLRVVCLHQSKRIRPLDPHLYLEIDTIDSWDFAEPYADLAQAGCSDSRLCLTLPLPPSINAQYYTDREGMRRLTPQALLFKDEVRKLLHELCQQGFVREAFLERMRNPEVYLALSMDYCFATPLSRDLDNGCKIAIDALCKGLSREAQAKINDNRIVDLHQCERLSPTNPHLTLEIDTLDDWAFDETYTVLRNGG